MKHHLISIIVFVFFTVSTTRGQTTATERGLHAITVDALKAQLGFLSSDWMEGREAGEKGEYMAADYIASMLQSYGIKPGGDYQADSWPSEYNEEKERTYFQNFILLKTMPGEEQVLKIKSSDNKTVKSSDLTYNVDFTFRPADQSAEIEAPVVFTGYGYINDSIKYNDFNKLDVRGKYILKIAGFPKFINENLDKEKIKSLRAEMESRYKAMGIIGVLEFEPDAPCCGQS